MTSKHSKRRMFASGRNEKKETWVQINHGLYDHPSVVSLSCSAFRVWTYVIRSHNGFNNGEIGVSCRSVQKLTGISKNTAMRALNELREHGLVVRTDVGAFYGRLAATYRLTHLNYGNGGQHRATHEYKNWSRTNNKLQLT